MVIVNLVKLRAGVDPEDFASFAQERDGPTWRAKDVVLAFDTYRVAPQDAGAAEVDFIEVMHIRSWSEWETVSQNDPDVIPLATMFAELADARTVRTLTLRPVERRHGEAA
jgi:hypothetical protein